MLGIGFQETFTLVVKFKTTLLVVAMATHLNWEIEHLNVITTFWNGIMKETVFMTQPPS